MKIIENARMELKDLLQYYTIDDIYNTDELGLYYCLGPSKTLASKDDKAKGYKKDKKRITVLLTANASGSFKLKPLVINDSKNPRALKNIHSFAVNRESNKSAWMNGTIWLKWLKWFDNQLLTYSILLADSLKKSIGLFNLITIIFPHFLKL